MPKTSAQDDQKIEEVLAKFDYCEQCRNTGVVETGNNDLPCSCIWGDKAVFNMGNEKLTGKEIKEIYSTLKKKYFFFGKAEGERP